MCIKKYGLLKAALMIISLAVFLSGCGFVRVNPEVDNNTVVAKVSGEEIKKEEFNKVFGIFKAQYEQQFGTEVWEQEIDGRKFDEVARERLLDMLIDERLQINKAAELGITVTEEEVNSEIENAKEYFDSEERFNEFLKAQSMDMDYFKETVRKDLIINKLADKLTENVTLTDEEVKNYYDTHQNEFLSVKASHILLETKEEAEEVLQKVKNGENFNELAREKSIDPSAKENSGDLGYFRQGDMVEPFEKAAFALKPGEISDIVQTDFGYHIIKVEDSKFDKFDDVKEQLKGSLLNKKKNAEYDKLIQEMRQNAEIEKFTKRLK